MLWQATESLCLIDATKTIIDNPSNLTENVVTIYTTGWIKVQFHTPQSMPFLLKYNLIISSQSITSDFELMETAIAYMYNFKDYFEAD